MGDLGKDKYFPLYILYQFLFLTALVVKPSPFRWILWLPIIGIAFHLFFSNPIGDSASDGTLRNAVVSYLFVASDYTLLTDAQNDLRRIDQKQSISSAPLWARLKWALKLQHGPRCVGWEHEPKAVLPPHPQDTRARFIISRAFWLVVHVMYIDLIHFLMRRSHFFERDAGSISLLPFHLQCWMLFLYVSNTFGQLNMMHIMLSIVSVATGISQPSRWPSMFGRWGDAYTIRKFWGRTWHQMLRRLVSSHGKFLTRHLGLPSGGNPSSYVQLYTAFLISGIIHIHPSDNRPLYFFLYQAIAITFEDGIIALAKKAGYAMPTRIYKTIGYAWVWCWFLYSIPPWMDSMLVEGMLEPGANFGIVDGIIRSGNW